MPDFIWLPQKRQSQWRREWNNTNVMFFFLSCLALSFLLTVCFPLSFFYLTLPNPSFLFCPPIFHLPYHFPFHSCFSDLNEERSNCHYKNSGLLLLPSCFTLFWQAFNLFLRQPFTLIGTLNPPIKSPKLALWAQPEVGRVSNSKGDIYNTTIYHRYVCVRVCFDSRDWL